jgi:hypothetical protein
MTTSAKTGACYTSLIGATVLAEVRTISGLPTRCHLQWFYEERVSNSFREFWVIATVLKSTEIITQIAVRRSMPSEIFWKKIDILEAAKGRVS